MVEKNRLFFQSLASAKRDLPSWFPQARAGTQCKGGILQFDPLVTELDRQIQDLAGRVLTMITDVTITGSPGTRADAIQLCVYALDEPFSAMRGSTAKPGFPRCYSKA